MLGHFGFSYIGLIYLIMLMFPNLIWTKNQPKDYSSLDENKLLVFLERTGEVLVTCVALIFSDFNINNISIWSTWLLVSFSLMCLYEYWWIRYFRSKKTLKDFYSSILKIPVAGATLPVISFLLLGIYGRNIWMILSVLILGIGHIGIHLEHLIKIQTKEKVIEKNKIKHK